MLGKKKKKHPKNIERKLILSGLSGRRVNIMLEVHRNHKAYYGRGEGGKGVWRWWGNGGGGEEIIYLSLHCHRQNDSRIKVGIDESHFNVS